MLQFVLRNPHLAYVQQGEQTLASAPKTSLPTSNNPVFSKKKTYKWTLQPSQEMELLQEQENMENPEQPDSPIFQIAWKN